jgi:hypothetical protein
MGRSVRSRGSMSENRRYRKFSAQQKSELVLASLRGPKTISELCREHDISESLLRKWREQFLAAGAQRLRARPSGPRPTSSGGRSVGSSGRWGARRWRWRSRGNSCGDGSERARRPFPRAGRARPPGRRRRPDRRNQPPGDLPAPEAAAGRAAASLGTRSTGSCWMSRTRTRPTARGWLPPWPGVSCGRR